jgi:uncharacterized coiled-coil protein SlyX
MTNAWDLADYKERIHELEIARAEALGALLGIIDVVMLAEEHPEVFRMAEKLERLREARKAYDVIAAAYVDVRLAAR